MSGFLIAAELKLTLSAPFKSNCLMSSIVFTPPPTVIGIKHFSAVFLTRSIVTSLFSRVAAISKKQISSAPASSYAWAARTGSPASFKFLKFIPLTTLPSFTSRQGIIPVSYTHLTLPTTR